MLHVPSALRAPTPHARSRAEKVPDAARNRPVPPTILVRCRIVAVTAQVCGSAENRGVVRRLAAPLGAASRTGTPR